MAETTKIQWCDHTFNPWRGCTKIAPGCANCYADAQSRRNPKTLGVWGPQGTRVVAAESQWKAVERWNREAGEVGKRRRVFCASLADVFENWTGPMLRHDGCSMWICPQCGVWRDGALPEKQIVAPWCYQHSYCRPLTMADVRLRLFRLIDACPHLDFLLLTKRPQNVRKFWPWGWGTAETSDSIAPMIPRWPDGELIAKKPPHRKNVWLLTSVSDQKTADENIPALLQCRDLVPVLGISAEPLIGPIDLNHLQPERIVEIDCLNGTHGVLRPHRGTNPALDWVIVGGESGPGARECETDWIRSIVRQCGAAGVPVFVKQLGRNPVWTSEEIAWGWHKSFSDEKGGDPSEWPEDLRVREFPEVRQ